MDAPALAAGPAAAVVSRAKLPPPYFHVAEESGDLVLCAGAWRAKLLGIAPEARKALLAATSDAEVLTALPREVRAALADVLAGAGDAG